ncbi:MAG TPA: hypothetical protein VN709_01120 [Terriglobales bacterium]|nr:hypothetical protein [Terriglobales bacterium]
MQSRRASTKSVKSPIQRAIANSYQVILDRLDAAVILIDHTGVIVALNFAAAALLKMRFADACGQPIASSPLWQQHPGLERLLEASMPAEFMLVPEHVRFRFCALGNSTCPATVMIEARDCSSEHQLRAQLQAIENDHGGLRLASVEIEALHEELDAASERRDSMIEAYAWENDRLRAELGRNFVLDQEWSLLLSELPLPVVFFEPAASTPAGSRVVGWNQAASRHFRLRGDPTAGVSPERLHLDPGDCARLLATALQVVNAATPAVHSIKRGEVHLIPLRGQVAAIWCDIPLRK